MNRLSNVFSILNLDVEDDKEQIASISNVKDEESKKKNSGFSTKGASPKMDKLEHGMTESFLGKFNKPLVWIDLEMTGNSIESEEDALISTLLDDNISPDEIDRHFDKNTCCNALDLTNIISSLGMPSASRLLRTSLFSVIIGSNDFINNYLTPVLSAPQRATTPPETFIDALISNYRLQLTRLYNLDARKIVASNVGPIGCIPYIREINPSAGTNCVAFPNQLAQRFNERLKDLIMELSSNLKGSIFVYANVYPFVSDIIQNYNSYGFEVADSACCFVPGRYGGLVPCGPTSKVCPDRSNYVFWDPYHPSDAANVIIAKRLLYGDQNDIFPMNVRQLVFIVSV